MRIIAFAVGVVWLISLINGFFFFGRWLLDLARSRQILVGDLFSKFLVVCCSGRLS